MARPRTTEIRRDELLAGRYRLLERLGAGGMAVVFLAEDTVLGRRVAVKRLHSSAPADGVRRFDREARLGASLNHPNLVTVFDTASEEDDVLIVMEYVPGTALSQAIESGPLEPERAIAVLRSVAAGLDHAHAHGVVHRDVKPSNVLLRRDGVVKLADLGVATAAHLTKITTANDVVGTLAYIAPERLEGAQIGGPPADVYSLAAVGFEALSGHLAQRGATPVEILRAASDGPAPDLRSEWPDAPPRAAEALRRGLNPDPDARPRSASELVAELEAALEPNGAPAPASAAPADPSEGEGATTEVTVSIPRPGRVAAVVGVVAMALAVVAIALSGSDGDDPGAGPAPSARERPENDRDASPEAGGNGTGAIPASAGRGDPAAGSEINNQGYGLLQEERYAEAVPVLERAVGSYPEGTTGLDYAYALYNLGNALRLSGRPEEAIPILERRLEIPNQRGVVKRELETARAEAAEQRLSSG